jgi:hypothetical protein
LTRISICISIAWASEGTQKIPATGRPYAVGRGSKLPQVVGLPLVVSGLGQKSSSDVKFGAGSKYARLPAPLAGFGDG